MAEDGKVDWRWRTGADVIGRRSPTTALVYFVSLDNVLRALNLVTGGQQWKRPLPMRPAWAPVQAGATIVVAGQAPPLRAFNIKDGAPAGDADQRRHRRRRAGRRRRRTPCEHPLRHVAAR